MAAPVPAPVPHTGPAEPVAQVTRLVSSESEVSNEQIAVRSPYSRSIANQTELLALYQTPADAHDFAAGQFAPERVRHVTGTSRPWQVSEYAWEAPALGHHPLYFEEINLERYGWSFGLMQPAVSTAHFFGHVLALPYMLADQHPCECVYNLGYYRPGACVPYAVHCSPLSLRAGVIEAGAVTGLIFLLP